MLHNGKRKLNFAMIHPDIIEADMESQKEGIQAFRFPIMQEVRVDS